MYKTLDELQGAYLNGDIDRLPRPNNAVEQCLFYNEDENENLHVVSVWYDDDKKELQRMILW